MTVFLKTTITTAGTFPVIGVLIILRIIYGQYLVNFVYSTSSARASSWLFVVVLLFVQKACFIFIQGVLLALMPKIKPGTYHRRCTSLIIASIKIGVVNQVSNFLVGTMVMPYWLKLAGMRVGKKVHVSSYIQFGHPFSVTVDERQM